MRMYRNLGAVYICCLIHLLSDFPRCLFHFSYCIVDESVTHLSCMFQIRFEPNMSNKKNIIKRLQRPVRVLLDDVMPKNSSADELQSPKQVNETAQGSSTMLKSYEQVKKDQGTSTDPSLTGQEREGEETASATTLPYYLVGNVR